MIRPLIALVWLAAAFAASAETPWQAHGPVKVSENHRFLVHQDGTPFFYLGDTVWELFHRSTREDADRYLEDRARKGFTVVQAVGLAEFDGLHGPNAYGFRPLLEDDPARPDTHEGPNNDYWDHVDYVVNKAAKLGLIVGFVPTWGDKWNKKWGQGPEIFTPENAASYGEWLGRRYREQPIIWILGGDRPVESDRHKEIIRAMAHGLRRGDGGSHLITFHPTGGSGSAEWAHGEDWLDFNMRQNGHGIEWNGRYEKTHADYERTPPKPVLDGEPVYEDHPVNFKPKELGYSVAADTRRALYWDLFGGACGHTYGHHAVWQLWTAQRDPVNGPVLPWTEAINQPGAGQMQHGRHLIESRPFLNRVPDDSIIVPSQSSPAIPGAGIRRIVATRDRGGRFAMVYIPMGRAVTVRMDKINGPSARAWLFDPREGTARLLGEIPASGEHTFDSPTPGELLDWVLVVDAASEKFPAPGTVGAGPIQ